MFAAQGAFRPFARAGIGVSLVRFSDDDVTGRRDPAARSAAAARERRAVGRRHRAGRARARLRPVQPRARRRAAARPRGHGRRRVPACDDPRRAGRRAGRSRRVAAWRVRERRRRRSTTTLVLRVTDRRRAGRRARAAVRRRTARRCTWATIDLYGKRQGARGVRDRAGRRRLVGRPDPRARRRPRCRSAAMRCVPSPAIPYGRYKVWAWRGIEYERWEGEVDLSADRGRVELAIALERAWTPHGTLAADLHVHAHASNDSTVPNPQRVIAQVAAGIQVVGAVGSQHERRPRRRDRRARPRRRDRVDRVERADLRAAARRRLPGRRRSQPRRAAAAPPEAPIAQRDAAAAVRRSRARCPAQPDRAAQPPAVPRHRALRRRAAGTASRGRRRSRSGSTPSRCSPATPRSTSPGDRRFDDGVRDFYTLRRSRPPDRAARQQRHARSQLGARRHDAHLRVRRRSAHAAVRRGRVHRRDPRAPRRRDDADRGSTSRSPPRRRDADRRPGPGRSPRRRQRVGRRHASSQARFVHAERIRITVGSAGRPALAQTIDVPPDVRTPSLGRRDRGRRRRHLDRRHRRRRHRRCRSS